MPKAKQEKTKEAPHYIDPKAENERLLEIARVKDNKIVRGIFKFEEVPGGTISFPFRKYKKDRIKKYTFEDGKVYEIPLCVAKHLNNNGKYPVHQHAKDKDGLTIMNVGRSVHRFSFRSLDFTDMSDSDSVAAMGPSQIDIV